MEKTEKVDIRCILKGAVALKFLKIWHKKGLENKTEVVRTLINDYYENHIDEMIESSEADLCEAAEAYRKLETKKEAGQCR